MSIQPVPGPIALPITSAQENTSSSSAPDFALGPDHLVQVANSRIAVLERDGTVLSNETFLEFFPELEQPNSPQELPGGDPQVVYDPHSNRFVVAVAEVKGHRTEPSDDDLARIHLAVSEQGRADGQWNRHTIDLETASTRSGVFADLLKLAVDKDAVYITHNATPFDDDAALERWIWRLPKDPETGRLSDDPDSGMRSVAPSVFAQSSSILPIADAGDGDSLVVALERWGPNGPEEMRIATVEETGGTPEVQSTVVSMGDLTSAGRLPDVEQPGDAPRLFTPNLFPTSGVIRNDVLTMAFTLPGRGENAGQQTAHWAQFDVTEPSDPRFLDAGAVDGESVAPGTHTFLPAVAVNGENDIAITFQAAGPQLAPGMYAAMHEAGAADGTTTDPVALAPGETAWITPVGHWGDSADAAVDPRDDTSFWATNTIVTGDQDWAAPIAHFTATEPAQVSRLPETFGDPTIDSLIATEETSTVPQVACPLQTAPGAIRAFWDLKEAGDGTTQAFPRGDHRQAA